MRDLHLFQMIQNEKSSILNSLVFSSKFWNFGLVRRCWRVILRINCLPPSTGLSISRVDYIHRPTLLSTNSCFCQMISILCHQNSQNGSIRFIISRDELIMLENLVYDILNYTRWFTKIFSCDLKIINTKWKNIVEITMCDLKNHLVWLFCSIILCRPVWL